MAKIASHMLADLSIEKVKNKIDLLVNRHEEVEENGQLRIAI